MKIIALVPNSTKFCIHNLCASRELEMEKLGAEVGCRGPGVGVGGECGIVGCRVGAEVEWGWGLEGEPGGRSSLASGDARRRRASQLVFYINLTFTHILS